MKNEIDISVRKIKPLKESHYFENTKVVIVQQRLYRKQLQEKYVLKEQKQNRDTDEIRMTLKKMLGVNFCSRSSCYGHSRRGKIPIIFLAVTL